MMDTCTFCNAPTVYFETVESCENCNSEHIVAHLLCENCGCELTIAAVLPEHEPKRYKKRGIGKTN